jgi:hydroxypyruvate isomerase
MLKMVKDSGYNGFIGIEFEGTGVSETEGIQLTRDLLINTGNKI